VPSITERTLKKWRKEALRDVESIKKGNPDGVVFRTRAERILRMTQELLDQHLLRKE